MSVIVVATLYPEPDHRAEVIEVLEESIAAAHGEDGCELYAMHEGPDRIVFIEKWASQEALDGHLGRAAESPIGPRLAGKIINNDIQVLSAHPAGTEERGAL
jgi:quinol monooxygenase YgiN